MLKGQMPRMNFLHYELIQALRGFFSLFLGGLLVYEMVLVLLNKTENPFSLKITSINDMISKTNIHFS